MAKQETVTVNLQPLLVPIAMVVSALFLSISIIIAGTSIGNGLGGATIGTVAGTGTVVGDTTTEPEGTTPQIVTVGLDDDAVLGNANDANIAIVEFSDFNCSFCQRHHTQVMKRLVEDFVDTGEAVIVYRDFPGVGGATTEAAAAAAECVRAQVGDQKYFNLIEKIYSSTASPKDVNLVVQLAKDINGVKEKELSQCIDNGTFADEVIADRSEAEGVGVTGTPGFVVGTISDDGTVTGELIAGAYPYEEFQRVIESLR